ncbi:hypothetical protein DICVIV_08645 [Dictyocaulus viviparus]|uniref:Uncharacterized protein n=1 Tax=Dictyocaulus viviparus TaxID=29172 RepID=A0A0D8XL36_DICVI|nr:hypothetical protein DICVIV_08645 [Dictyocaulus viviparus]
MGQTRRITQNNKASSIHAGFLVAAAVVRMSFTNFLGLFLPSLIVERVFASKFINDYEKLSRSWISKIILFITTTIAIFFSVTVALGFYTVSSIAITTCIIHIVYVFVYIYLFRKNYIELRDINQGIYQQNIRYTLSIKFQLTENQRVMKMLRHYNRNIYGDYWYYSN